MSRRTGNIDEFYDVSKSSIVVGKGSTGRTTARTVKERLVMETIVTNSDKYGTQIERITLRDPRWPSSEGWIKMEAEIEGVQIHWVKNTLTGQVDDFKYVN